MMDTFDLISRWLHVLAAMAAVGGTLFMRLAMLPATAQLSPDAKEAFLQAVRSRWAKVVMTAILLLLVSGLYNISRKEVTYQVSPLYHALFGIKFLLALGIFFLASALVGRSEAFAAIRGQAAKWLVVNLLLAVLVVCISGVLRQIELQRKPAVPGATKASADRTGKLAACVPAAPRQACLPRGTVYKALWASDFLDWHLTLRCLPGGAACMAIRGYT